LFIIIIIINIITAITISIISAIKIIISTLIICMIAYAKARSYTAVSNLLKLQPRDASLVVRADSVVLEAAKTSNHFKKYSASLSRLSPPSSSSSSSAEETRVIDLDLVQKGDVLKVFPGDRIPTDGFVLSGSSFVDESMITGESVAVLKNKGDAVFGSTVNQNGCVYICVTALACDSTLAQIVKVSILMMMMMMMMMMMTILMLSVCLSIHSW
jgi:P-type E1-E2 ATPase